MTLRSTMIHSYPREYRGLYTLFRDGGTIRKWVNEVERLGRLITEQNPQINQLGLQSQLPDGWTVTLVDNEFRASGPKDQKALHVMRTIGATWVLDRQEWVMTPELLAEYLDKETLYKFKGDMLEVFAEIFFTMFKADEGLGITEYSPVDLTDDFGVDATGVNVNGHQVAVQVKYRSNPDDLIPYSDIARTFTSAACQLHIRDVVDHDHTIYLFTTAKGVSVAYTKVMGNKSVIVPRGVIATKVDNNVTFWQAAYDMIMEATA